MIQNRPTGLSHHQIYERLQPNVIISLSRSWALMLLHERHKHLSNLRKITCPKDDRTFPRKQNLKSFFRRCHKSNVFAKAAIEDLGLRSRKTNISSATTSDDLRQTVQKSIGQIVHHDAIRLSNVT